MTHAAQGLTDLVRRSAAEAGVTLE
jgi:hypothetical protein